MKTLRERVNCITKPKENAFFIEEDIDVVTQMDALLKECAPFVMMCIEDSLRAEALYKKLQKAGYGQ